SHGVLRALPSAGAVKENIIGDEQRPGLRLDEALEGRFNFAVGAFLRGDRSHTIVHVSPQLSRYPTTGIAACCATRRERPRDRTAEQRDERAPLHDAPLRPRTTSYHIVIGKPRCAQQPRECKAQLITTLSPIRTVPGAATTAYTPAQGNLPRSPTCS